MKLSERIFHLRYSAKRYGVYGLFRRLLQKAGIREFDTVSYLNTHYYQKLSEGDYEKELKEWYRFRTGRDGRYIDSPETFNDKIQWLKLHDNSRIKEICADKYRVREYLEQFGFGDKLKLIPLLGVWDRAEDIDFNQLPDKFVLKQNAASGMNLIVKNKADINEDEVRKKLKLWLSTQYGYAGMERQYFAMPRKIIAEQYLEAFDGNLRDYKFHCFNGTPRIVEVIGDRDPEKHFAREAYYDENWKRLAIQEDNGKYIDYDHELEKPENLSEMLDIARTLSRAFIYVRVDLYSIPEGGRNVIYFGELTFTPANGTDKWKPDDVDLKIGQMLKLPIDGK